MNSQFLMLRHHLWGFNLLFAFGNKYHLYLAKDLGSREIKYIINL